MTKQKIENILARLDSEYGTEKICYLTHDNPWQFLISTILSAQCTDARVNVITKDLYRKYTSIEAFATADTEELMLDIKQAGFYRNKAKNIIECCKILHYEYMDEVPSDLDMLIRLPGVGRKTANVIRGNIYDIPSIVVDTHVKRISQKLGITKETDPEKIEYDLMKKLPKDHWILWNIHIITLGRTICKAINPDCEHCFLKDLCKSCSCPVKR